MPYIGQPIAWTPCAYCNLDGKENPKSTRERKKVRGRIVWINELHHFFLVEAQVFGDTMRVLQILRAAHEKESQQQVLHVRAPSSGVSGQMP